MAILVETVAQPIRLLISSLLVSLSNLALFGMLIMACVRQYLDLVGEWYRLDRFLHIIGSNLQRMWNQEELISADVEQYVRAHGFSFEHHFAKTKDGHILSLHRVYKEQNAGSSHPVLIQHGLFQSSGIFVTSGQDSLAFYLAERGFDVWLGNNRGVDESHESLSTESEEYWDWTLDELGTLDFPCLIDYVLKQTNQTKLTYIGHSQGSAQAFIGLSQNPGLSDKIQLFIALAPAYFINKLPHWSLRFMTSLDKHSFRLMFGTKAFLPIMTTIQKNVSPHIFTSLAYPMFSFLFNWGDRFWNKAKKASYFVFTPRPLSTKLIEHWGQICRAGCLVRYSEREDEPRKLYPLEDIRCKTAIFYGGSDSLVHGKKLEEELRKNLKNLLHHAEELPKYEHMDLLWATEAKHTVFGKLVAVIHSAFESHMTLSATHQMPL